MLLHYIIFYSIILRYIILYCILAVRGPGRPPGHTGERLAGGGAAAGLELIGTGGSGGAVRCLVGWSTSISRWVSSFLKAFKTLFERAFKGFGGFLKSRQSGGGDPLAEPPHYPARGCSEAIG